MKLTSNGRSWDFDPLEMGGLLQEMSSEGFKEVDASHISPEHIDAFTKRPSTLTTEELVAAFKVAYFLQANSIPEFGKELSARMSLATYEEIRQISSYFDK